MIEDTLLIDSPSGPISTFLCLPDRGGPHPGVIFYMDGFGIREELRQMVRRLAAVGYAVAMPDLYHRIADDPDYAQVEGPAGFPMMLKRMHSLTNAAVVEDTAAVLSTLAANVRVRKGPVGALGYCMSGQFILSALASYPDRFSAAACFYGVGTVTDAPDSPHLAAAAITAELYLGCAGEDPYVPASLVEQLDEALAAASCRYEIEIYPGLSHGFAFPQREAYDLSGAERHWERTFELFARCLD